MYRLVSALVLCAVALTSARGDDKPILAKGGRLVISGDSITEQKLYSRYMETYLTACHPELDLWIMQLGWSGERAPGFANRMDFDLLAFKPTVVTTCYGMNDGSYQPYKDAIGAEYKKYMTNIVERAKKAGVTVVVGSPGAVDLHFFKNPNLKPAVYNDNLAHLRDIAKQIAADEKQVFANVHDTMYETMVAAQKKLGDDYPVCGGDGFHPGPNGQLIMAYAFLKALKVNGTVAEIAVDMNADAKASPGHTVASAKDGVIEIESSRYPFCHFGDSKSPNSTRSILPFLPFDQDLNRFMLTVVNLKAGKATVMWGKAKKEFTKEQLEKGVNLAAEFDETPFAAAFQKVDGIVGAKQNHETVLIKNYHVMLRGWQNEWPNDSDLTAAVNTIAAKLHAKQAKLSAAARAAVVPVKHTIRVIPE
jgi:lysophospholipase L1-like esterase